MAGKNFTGPLTIITPKGGCYLVKEVVCSGFTWFTYLGLYPLTRGFHAN